MSRKRHKKRRKNHQPQKCAEPSKNDRARGRRCYKCGERKPLSKYNGRKKHCKACVSKSDPFPSSRQSKANGLRREFYAQYLRDCVDVDYAHKLNDEERVWLAAFLEEHYRGLRFKSETQLLPVEMIRESAADQKRTREHEDPLAFHSHRGPSIDQLEADALEGDGFVQARLLAGSDGIDLHEMYARNSVEDEMIAMIDRKRRMNEES